MSTRLEKKTKVVIFGALKPRDYPIEAQELVRDPSWEVWVMNAAMPPERWDRWFQLHSYQHMLEAHGLQYIRQIKTMCRHYEQPVYIFDKWEDKFPGCHLFPHATLVEQYGSYFTGSFAWLLAFARHLEFKEVYINAGDMGGEEWARP